MRIRVLLVDDQALFREGLHTLLSVWPDLEVVGEAGNGQEALDAAARLKPAVVLMDLRMPVLDGVAATRRLPVAPGRMLGEMTGRHKPHRRLRLPLRRRGRDRPVRLLGQGRRAQKTEEKKAG